jgi:hypothetical protein
MPITIPIMPQVTDMGLLVLLLFSASDKGQDWVLTAYKCKQDVVMLIHFKYTNLNRKTKYMDTLIVSSFI